MSSTPVTKPVAENAEDAAGVIGVTGIEVRGGRTVRARDREAGREDLEQGLSQGNVHFGETGAKGAGGKEVAAIFVDVDAAQEGRADRPRIGRRSSCLSSR